MIIDSSVYAAGLAGFVVSLLVSVALVASKRIHGKLSLDTIEGVQKFHTAPTPRVGGIAILAGFLAGRVFLDPATGALWGLVGLAGLPAFAFGLAEDVTKKVRVKWRLLATIFSGLLFAMLTGTTIDSVDLPGIDTLLGVSFVALAFTAFAIGGAANSINLIDGFHGLSSGTLVIILAAFAIVGARVGDADIIGIALVMLAIMAGFFVVNFPLGKLFLGDAGAYFAGYVVAVLAVMLPARNPEVSPWISLLVLGYPVTETLFSILRRLPKAGHSPGDPDSDHLHHLVYRAVALRLVPDTAPVWARNALTSVFVWALPLLTLVAAVCSNLHTAQALPLLLVVMLVYLALYRAARFASRHSADSSPTGNRT